MKFEKTFKLIDKIMSYEPLNTCNYNEYEYIFKKLNFTKDQKILTYKDRNIDIEFYSSIDNSFSLWIGLEKPNYDYSYITVKIFYVKDEEGRWQLVKPYSHNLHKIPELNKYLKMITDDINKNEYESKKYHEYYYKLQSWYKEG